MNITNSTAIVLGDSFNNTLGLIRSLGQVGAKIILILVGGDRLFIRKSRYVRELFKVTSLSECGALLREMADVYKGAFLICSNDKAAKWIDDNESWLSKLFLTPMRGKQLGDLFDKPHQCKLAEEFGVKIPCSVLYENGSKFPTGIDYPILMKPANSNNGEKSDIHICRNRSELDKALKQTTSCSTFIIQEYIEKDFEINLIGISTDSGVIIPGGIRKIRHYPTIYSPCSFGQFLSINDISIDTEPIKKMIEGIGYKGPFSVEFLRKGSQSYFMEINFRHDGLAYAATSAGVNLLKFYVNAVHGDFDVKPIYLMDLSTDYCHVKDGNISRKIWISEFIRTQCQLNFNWKDPMPTVFYYMSKFRLIKNKN